MEADPVLYDRFQREAEIGEKLDHPGVMKVLADDDRSQLYMVMEWVNGRLLRQVLHDSRKLPVERATKSPSTSRTRSITSIATAWCTAI
jgi:serine/threonine protein kinase